MAVPVVQVAGWPGIPGVRHAFTTRQGGVSPAPRGSLHLALRDGDAPEDVVENWRRALASIDAIPDRVALLEQVHGDRVVRVDAPTGPLATVGPADGAVTTEPGLVLAVRVADCVPVLLAAPGGVGVAHAGWRGLAAGILPACVGALCIATGCRPEQVRAAVGPHAGVGAYETGDAVVEALVAAGLDRARIARPGPRGRLHTDLGAAAHDQLRQAGVARIATVGRCTLTDTAFFSHRRDGAATGRQAGLIVREVA